MNEQVEQTAIQETDVTTTASVETVVENNVTFTSDEYKKTLQSERSKAKYELLQELGITSVQEFKSLQQKQNEENKVANDNYNAMCDKVAKYEKDIAGLNDEIVVMRSGVSDDYKQDALTLARTKVTDDKPLSVALEEVLSKNPYWKASTAQNVKIGTEKQNDDKDVTKTYDIDTSVYKALGLTKKF